MSSDPFRALVGAGRRARPRVELVARSAQGADAASGLSLATGRAHEVCGPAALVFAAMTAAALAARTGPGPVLWIRGPRAEGRPNPDGLAALLDPARLVLAAPRRAEDVLWCAEEALRTGAAGLVVAELERTPGLTAVRRLHLAAEAADAAGDGMRSGGVPPLALLLTPGEGGAQGVETRWRMAPASSVPDRGGRPCARWRLDLLRARMARPRGWIVGWTGDPATGGGLLATPAADPAPPRPPRRRRVLDAGPAASP